MTYKKASDSAQDRADRRIFSDRINEHGVDSSVFKEEDEQLRNKLVVDKKRLETHIGELRRQINDASAVAKGFRRGERVSDKVFRRWQLDVEKAKREILEIEEKLKDFKDRKRQYNFELDAEKEKRFERAFMRMAKELLATPVYDRIVLATIHKFRDEEDVPAR